MPILKFTNSSVFFAFSNHAKATLQLSDSDYHKTEEITINSQSKRGGVDHRGETIYMYVYIYSYIYLSICPYTSVDICSTTKTWKGLEILTKAAQQSPESGLQYWGDPMGVAWSRPHEADQIKRQLGHGQKTEYKSRNLEGISWPHRRELRYTPYSFVRTSNRHSSLRP